jgi:hypothetical protein
MCKIKISDQHVAVIRQALEVHIYTLRHINKLPDNSPFLRLVTQVYADFLRDAR